MHPAPEQTDRPRPLATERPWLAVAGCLGGGTIAIALAFFLLLAALVIFFVYAPDIFSSSREQVAPSATEATTTQPEQ